MKDADELCRGFLRKARSENHHPAFCPLLHYYSRISSRRAKIFADNRFRYILLNFKSRILNYAFATL